MDIDSEMSDVNHGSNNLSGLLGKRKERSSTQPRSFLPSKRLCAIIDVQLPAEQSIVISPASPRPSPLQLRVPNRGPSQMVRHKSAPTFSISGAEPFDFSGIAVHKGELVELSLSNLLSHTNKWIMIVFFPQHFTFADPEKLLPFFHSKLVACCEVIACSHDSQYALLAWYNQSGLSTWTNHNSDGFYLLSDLNHSISQTFSSIIHKIDGIEQSDAVSIVVLDNKGYCKFSFNDFHPSRPT